MFRVISFLVAETRLCNRKNVLACFLQHVPTKILTCNYNFAKNMSSTSKVIFKGSVDRFNGVTVNSEKENCATTDFTQRLLDSLETWKTDGKRGIWFKIYLQQSDWVPILAKNGFKYHHAQEEYVMMYLWLPKDEICNIPHYAHTMVGVGAVVINDKSQVLVVSEKYFIGETPYWKLPGGYVEPDENLVDAAIREVFEETNIQTKFESVLTFRHTHHAMFRCSDIYTVVSLIPISNNIEKCTREIADCKWMDIEEYMKHPNVHELNRFFVQKYLEYKKHNLKIDCFHGIHKLLDKPYTVYHIMNKYETAEKEQFNESTK